MLSAMGLGVSKTTPTVAAAAIKNEHDGRDKHGQTVSKLPESSACRRLRATRWQSRTRASCRSMYFRSVSMYIPSFSSGSSDLTCSSFSPVHSASSNMPIYLRHSNRGKTLSGRCE